MTQPTPWILHRTGLTGGQYRGFLRATGEETTPPHLTLHQGDHVLSDMETSEVDGGWQVRGTLGPSPLTEGTQTITVRAPDGMILDSLGIVVGLDAPEDLRVEVDLLRQEIAVLKTALRRHVNDR